MARVTMPVAINLNLTPSTRIKTEDVPQKDLHKGSSAAAGIVFGLLCSTIAWMFLAYGIYRLHAMSIAVR
ncbi:hypothetical protein RBB79_09840 [Tunturiibacter empetritectus]|uniref:Uncharacterized protein n=2 Tax=Tunturiibacter TaxID=3154218 RepID=A0A852VHD6_9BACT|nr:hypothetical protein [Edaphobacter lichenicola]NYF89854.1 hypothetical protein [Edaphobacter lichenicola]